MAKISLRAYIQEIDNLIERQELDAAIAHCRSILQTYPKDVDSYRLLGKAYLEAKRYGDAADIFQRVLSAIPDDFVSLIGMAIIREDEGNIDASIWHMERAFETNPSNLAIQQELRRLIGRRDGIEPQKIRLTRGALARMYARGDLYPQAIAELRAALKADPDRPDLQLLLSEMYWRIDNPIEAARVSTKLLEKLPFCRNANRIMAAILHSKDKIEEAAVYHRRLAALDPYAALVETPMDDPKTVDDALIQIEKLSWRPGQPLPAGEPERPDWAASLSEELGAEPLETFETIPPWLASIAPPLSEEKPEAPEPDQETLPSWMREAGWTAQEGDAEEAPEEPPAEEPALTDVGPEEQGLAAAEIPSWLQDIAPEPSDKPQAPDMPTEAAPEAEPILDLPDEIPPGPSKATEDEIPEVPTWLEESSPGPSDTIISWLSKRVTGEDAAFGQPSEFAGDERLGEVAEEEAEPEAVQQPPSWLSAVAEAAKEDRPTTDEMEFLREGTDAEPSTAPSTLGQEEVPEWLREIAEPQPESPARPAAVEATPEIDTEPIASAPDAPEDDWSREFRSESTLSAAAPEAVAEQPELPPDDDAALPLASSEPSLSELEESEIWLEELATASSSPQLATTPSLMDTESPLPPPESEAQLPPEQDVIEEQTGDLEWLDRLAQRQGVDIGPPEKAEAATAGVEDLPGETPDWLRDIVAETGELTPLEELATPPSGEEEPELPRHPEGLPEETVVASDVGRPESEAAPEAIPGEESRPAEIVPEPLSAEEVAIEELPEEPSTISAVEIPMPVDQIDQPAPPQAAPPPVSVASMEEILLAARQAMEAGDIPRACSLHAKLIENRIFLPEIIDDLRAALRLVGDSPDLWLALGDAYMKGNNLPDAVEAYRRGMEAV